MEIIGGAKINCESTDDECRLFDIDFKVRKEEPDAGYKRVLEDIKNKQNAKQERDNQSR